MPEQKRSRKSKSIQAERDGHSYKTRTARLNAETRRKAWNIGKKWDADEVGRMVTWIENDRTSYEMATDLGRTLYGTMTARAHLSFCLRHEHAIWGDRLKRRRSNSRTHD